MPLLLALIASFVAIPVSAYRGRSYRGAYFGWAAGLLLAGVVSVFMSDTRSAAIERPDLADAFALMETYLPFIAIWCFGTAFAALIGGLIWRKPSLATKPSGE